MDDNLRGILEELLDHFQFDSRGTHCLCYDDEGLSEMYVTEEIAEILDQLRDIVEE